MTGVASPLSDVSRCLGWGQFPLVLRLPFSLRQDDVLSTAHGPAGEGTVLRVQEGQDAVWTRLSVTKLDLSDARA